MNNCSSNPVNGAPEGQRFFGKYRGKVLDNIDPLVQGRILAEVPSIFGSRLNWALPCTPYAGDGVGFYAIPPLDANVWIEFEAGDPGYPIWSGCFWGPEQVPRIPEPPPPEVKVFKTEFVTMILNDIPEEGGFTLRCEPEAVDTPLTMLFNSEGVTILCPEASIKMTPGSIECRVPESVVSIIPEEIGLSVPASSLKITGELISVKAPDISQTAEGAVEISAGGDASVSAGGAVEISATGDVSIEAGGACEMTAAVDVAVTAGAAAEITAGADLAITAVGATEITAVGVAITGLTEVSGDLLMDGQQVLAL